jgi:hypothetical protein
MKITLCLALVGAFALGLTACSVLDDSGEVLAEIREPSTLLLHNHTRQTVTYFVGDEEVMARINILFEPGTGPTIAPGASAEVPFDEIAFFSEETRRLWIGWSRADGHGDLIRLEF